MDLDTDDIDVNELRRALGCFVTGVTVITTIAADGEPRGFTANSFTSVSLDPPLVLACIARRAGSFDVFRNARAFAVNILQEDQRDLSATFASSSKPDKFAGLQWTTSKAGSPLLPACSAWLDCEMHEQIEAGDHVILIGRVVDFAHSPRMPLGYYSGSYVGFGMERRAVEGLTADRQVVVGGIFEKDGDVLLLSRGGELHLPESHRLGSEDDRSSGLFAELAKIGVRADLNFVYAVFQDQGSGLLHVFLSRRNHRGPCSRQRRATGFARADRRTADCQPDRAAYAAPLCARAIEQRLWDLCRQLDQRNRPDAGVPPSSPPDRHAAAKE